MPDESRFTYRTHKEFYPEYCGLSKDPGQFQGTTREVFTATFLASTPQEQARIIKGVLERFPVGEGLASRTEELKTQFLEEAKRLEKQEYVDDPEIAFTSEVVFEALKDAAELIRGLNSKRSDTVFVKMRHPMMVVYERTSLMFLLV